MLESLHVKNLALMEETEVEFGPGLNILTGETGAGKSLLMGSVNLALGGKFDPSMLRKGADSAFVELVFREDAPQVREVLREMDLEEPEEDLIVITRRMAQGKSVCRINGETVTARQVRDLASVLIDIHGQHEHESLLHRRKHLEILDAFCAEQLGDLPAQVAAAYAAVKATTEELAGEEKDTDLMAKEQALAEFETKEIADAHLTPGEDEELERQYRRMVNSQKIMEGLGECYGATGGEDGSAAELISRALRSLIAITPYDEGLKEYEQQLSELDDLLGDFNRGISSYLSDAEFDGETFREVEDRLNLVNHLKDKYGRTIEEVLAYAARQQALLDKYSDYDAYLTKLKSRLAAEQAELEKVCEKLSAVRTKQAKVLQKELKNTLLELNFASVDFEISCARAEKAGPNGFDEVEFRISTNPGAALSPLQDVASGGELSRVMLAIKTVIADRDRVGTLIFDEIDAGISGRTAWKVSRQLGRVGASHQVICITHLPQIAAMADAHFVIEKSSSEDSAITDVRRVEGEESLGEIARLLGSDELTKASLDNARELREQALEVKKEQK